LSNNILSGIMGLVVGDALGVPVEFQDRENLRLNPVKDMRDGDMVPIINLQEPGPMIHL